MPEWFSIYLKRRSDEDAEEIWNWLDSSSDAVLDMIEVIAESHPKVLEKVMTVALDKPFSTDTKTVLTWNKKKP